MSPLHSLCGSCNKPGTKSCAGCHIARYCSANCQKADWKIHKLLCRTFGAFSSAARPGPKHRRAIFFPVHALTPVFIWLSVEVKRDADDIYEDAQLGTLLDSGGRSLWARSEVQQNILLGRGLEHRIELRFRGDFSGDGSLINESISKNIKIVNGVYPWRGPLVAFGLNGMFSDPEFIDDLDTTDLKPLLDFLGSYGKPNINTMMLNFWPGDGVQGVLINCIGEQKTMKRPEFQKVEVPPHHPIFLAAEESQIAKEVGMPILARKVPLHPEWQNSEASKNPSAEVLHLQIDSGHDLNGSFGKTTSYWQGEVGSVLVVGSHQGSSVSTAVLKDLVQWCRDRVAPAIQGCLRHEVNSTTINRNDLRENTITRKKFLMYQAELGRTREHEVNAGVDSDGDSEDSSDAWSSGDSSDNEDDGTDSD